MLLQLRKKRFCGLQANLIGWLGVIREAWQEKREVSALDSKTRLVGEHHTR